MSLWMTITKIGRKEDLEEESYFRKLSLCYRFPPDVTSCFAEVTLKRKMPATGYIPEGDIVICCVNLLAGFVSFRYSNEFFSQSNTEFNQFEIKKNRTP